MKVFGHVLEMIGQTPLLRLNRLNTGLCTLYLKLETQNPGLSIKDRIALAMVEAAEQAGDIRPGDTLIEGTAGNTGLGLAIVAAQKGYQLIIVLPDKMSREKLYNLRALGVEVIETRSDVQKGHPEYYQDLAERLSKERGAFYLNQFENAANVQAHYETTGPEIWQQTAGKIDTFVCGVGSGGTLTGIGRYLREQKPAVEIVVADPAGSILAPLINEGKQVQAGSWRVEGIGEDFVPSICELELADQAYAVSDQESFRMAREVLVQEGVLVGSSTGTLIAAALAYCQQQTEPKQVVTLACDTGARYLSKLFNDEWLAAQQFEQ